MRSSDLGRSDNMSLGVSLRTEASSRGYLLVIHIHPSSLRRQLVFSSLAGIEPGTFTRESSALTARPQSYYCIHHSSRIGGVNFQMKSGGKLDF